MIEKTFFPLLFSKYIQVKIWATTLAWDNCKIYLVILTFSDIYNLIKLTELDHWIL
jgi:hypothetical protein